jgi:hypothetical protein
MVENPNRRVGAEKIGKRFNRQDAETPGIEIRNIANYLCESDLYLPVVSRAEPWLRIPLVLLGVSASWRLSPNSLSSPKPQPPAPASRS